MKHSLLTALVACSLAAIGSAQSRTHELPLKPQTIHWGYYDPKIPPALKIASGDRVRVETMIAGGLARLRLAGVSEAEIPDSLKAVENAITERGPGAHPMSGPIYIEGAEPGDSIEVRILSIEFLHNFGVGAFNPGGGTLPDDFPYAHLKLVRWQPGTTTVEFAPGITLKLAPFFGSIGVAPPPLVGRISSRPPGYHGGNLDNKDLVAGSTLYLPVHVPGALLSIGDGHGLQADGEVTGTALETSLRGLFEIRVRKGKRLLWPRAETPTDYISMGLSEDLDEASRLATREMVDFLVAEKGLTRDAAYVLCSFAANLHVTQSVDQTKGVHATLSKSIFSDAPRHDLVRNDLPQTYKTTRDWGELPAGVKWAAVTAVEPAPDGSIYVIHRCFANSCAGRSEAPILKYNAAGKLLQTLGAGMFVFPHGATVDRDGNLWVTDAGGEPGKGHQVFKFNPQGKVIMTLGKAGVSGSGPDLFDQPTDIVVAPNGDLFVTDSHRNGKNNRVVKFSKDGKFIKEWGKKGSGKGEMSEPHTIAMDSRGRLFVGDRENNRIQIFDQQGVYLDEWRQFGRPSGIYIAKDDTMYVADSESGPDTGAHELMGIKKGIRIGSAKDGSVTAFIEDSESTTGPHSGAEGVGVDAQGNVYGAVVRRQMLERHVPVKK